MRSARAVTLIAVAILLRSAWDCTPQLQANWRLWSRLRAEHRAAPDTTWDRYYAELVPYLPAGTSLGLLQEARPGTPQREREYYFLQYSLAPRLVQPDARDFFVVMPPSAAVLDFRTYAPVRVFDRDFALYRRITR